jgi:hypothetical protein
MASALIGVNERQRAALDYSYTLFYAYFSSVAPYEIMRPTGCAEHILILFVLQQFKGLVEIGYPVNEQRLQQYFPKGIEVNLSIQPKVIAGVDSSLKAYVDIEGSVVHPREIAIIFARGGVVIYVYHVMVNNKQNPKDVKFHAKHIHGIAPWITNATTRASAVLQALEILVNFDPEEIIANGDDVEKLLPTLRHKIRDRRLKPWCVRPFHYSHHVNRLFKLGEIVLPMRPPCVGHCHDSYEGPKYAATTIGQQNKAIHGYHCALADAYELMLYEVSANRTKEIDVLFQEAQCSITNGLRSDASFNLSP